MIYLTEPKDRTFVEGHGFSYLTKNIGKRLSGKYSAKLVEKTSW